MVGDKFISSMLGDLDASGRMWARGGIVALIVAAAMSFDFGREVSWKHAVFLGILSAVAAFGPEVAHKAWEDRKRVPAIVIAIVCVPLLCIEFFTHAGYTAGIRGANIETATVQNARFDLAQDSAKDDASNVGLWRKQLADLQSANQWAATVKADALRGQLVTLKERIDAEQGGKRGRKAGCRQECERLQNEAAALEQRISTVEQATDLTARIEATQRILDKKRDKAATVEHKSSTVAHQNDFLARAVTLVAFGSLTPSAEVREVAQQSTSIAMAAVGTGLPAFCFFVAGLHRRRRTFQTNDQRKNERDPMAESLDTRVQTFSAAYRRQCEARGTNPMVIA